MATPDIQIKCDPNLKFVMIQFKTKGSLCRNKMQQECDLEEFCTGNSAEVFSSFCFLFFNLFTLV